QKLLSDIKDSRIDCVVVYKVDRLSRSLLDFTKLLEFFDKCNVAFVSVTQAFNTNTSMGRLTLNILLSFAQFEREIISERTRDKMGAARKKGRWLGGQPILGYDIDKENHKLIINEKEAKLVCEIFNLYIKERSLLSVAMILNEKGCKTKRYVTRSGKVSGDVKFKNTHIQHIIRNILYTGKVRYNGEIYQGMHEPIVTGDIFKQAQEVLANNRVKRNVAKNVKNIGLLSHILRCNACNSAMLHTYTSKGKYKYRYYVCTNGQKYGHKSCPNCSINAQQIEDAVIDCLKKIASDPDSHKQIKDKILTQKEFEEVLSSILSIWDTLFVYQKRRALELLLEEVKYDAQNNKVSITLNEKRIKFLCSHIEEIKHEI
ncbi:MAG: recombinase family protein, partial [Candidatus Omnitrophota bacterium]